MVFRKVRISAFVNRFIEIGKKDLVVVLDSSCIIGCGSGIVEFAGMNTRRIFREKILIPKKAYDEVHDPELKKIIERNRDVYKIIEPKTEYREIAKKYLEQTTKNKMYLFIKRLPEEIKRIQQLTGEEKKTAEREYLKNFKFLRDRILREEKIDINEMMDRPDLIISEIKRKTGHNYEMSEGDADVLAIALEQAKEGRHPCIGERDIDFDEAIALIKKDERIDNKIKNNLDFVSLKPYL